MLALVLSTIVLQGSPLVPPAQDEAQPIFAEAVDAFLAGRFQEAADGFDRVVALRPELGPQLWQRGIALFYAGRFADCRTQFESHRAVNPADVENAAWHFLCVARLTSAEEARALLLPVGRDPRRPLPEIYEMLEGTMTPDQVLSAAGDDPAAGFYAHLYIGLYQDALGNRDRALEHMRIAAANQDVSGYMALVAVLHRDVLERQAP